MKQTIKTNLRREILLFSFMWLKAASFLAVFTGDLFKDLTPPSVFLLLESWKRILY